MARIPENELQRLKGEVSVERLVEASGIALKKSGKGLLGNCPFHDDDEPSLVVTPAKNLWHCFGCGLGGNPIDWVMKLQGVSFRHAVELLKTDLAGDISPLAAGKPISQSTVPKLPPPVAFDTDNQVLLNQVVDYYHATLKTAPEALAYLESRGLTGEPLALAIATFKLGYANRTLGLRLPEKNRVAGADIRSRLQAIGIYRESGHEHFNGSLIIPIFDESGNVVEVYGRKVNDNLRAGTPKHLYLPGQHRGIWNINALVESKEVILCEALIDALTFWCAGYRNVTSCYGIEGFTDEMLEAFTRYGINRILIAFDRDGGGERGAAKVAEKLMETGIECFRVRFPQGLDANSYAVQQGKTASESLGKLIRQAQWLGNGKPASLPETAASQVISGDLAFFPNGSVAASLILPQAVKPVLSAAEGEDGDLLPLAAETTPDPLPASPLPEPQPDLPLIITDNDIRLTLGEGNRRHYRIRGFSKNLSVEAMKINLLVSADAGNSSSDAENPAGNADNPVFYVDTLDLYHAKQRGAYVAQASQETGLDERVLKTDLGRILLALEQLQAGGIDKTLQPKPKEIVMPEADREAALAWLRSPELMAQIVADFAAIGLIGEDTNKLMAYLAAVSRKLDNPLAVLVQSSSAAGKSALMDAVLAFVPDEDKVKYSAMTGQSLYYMGETNLKHKILAISEEEGASRASYALKLLQSEGELLMASTAKDPNTGNLITQAYKVEGPVMLLLTTTAIDIDEELLNRCTVLSVDEGREQTEAIHRQQRQRRTLQGLQAKQEKQRLTALHQNAQRLLKPLAVVNPYADQLTFLSDKTRTRRDHEKYLTLIDTIALLHQCQRPIKTLSAGGNGNANGSHPTLEYIEVSLQDIAAANAIAHEILGNSLDDLPPQTRKLLSHLADHINAHCQTQAIRRCDARLSRKQIRQLTGWGDTQLRVHLDRLVQMEHLTAHRDGSGGRYAYELLYDGDTAQNLHLSGLIDPDKLGQDNQDKATIAKSRGDTGELAGASRGDSGQLTAGLHDQSDAANPVSAPLGGETGGTGAKTHVLPTNSKTVPYPNQPLPLAALGG
ncbi:hypothetical protein MCAMS1_01058 [biofilm metagenome]